MSLKLKPSTRRSLLYGSLLSLSLLALWTVVAVRSEPIPSPQPAEPPLTRRTESPAERPPAGAPVQTPVPTVVEPVPKVRKHLVAAGETAEGIAAQYGLSPTSILWSNQISDETLLQIDQELLIPPNDGILHTVAPGDTIWDVAMVHSVEPDDVIRANPDIAPDALQLDQTLFVPRGAPIRRSTQIVSRSGSVSRPAAPQPVSPPPYAANPTSLIWPLSGEITDQFGWRTHPIYGTRNYHEGIDIAVPEGTPVKAVAVGRVTLAEWYGGYGLTVKVDHGGGLVSRYSHNSALLVAVGDPVEPGQNVAHSGDTGVSTGPHLDFGLYQGGEPFDPLTLLPR